jgi:hypothetical protein
VGLHSAFRHGANWTWSWSEDLAELGAAKSKSRRVGLGEVAAYRDAGCTGTSSLHDVSRNLIPVRIRSYRFLDHYRKVSPRICAMSLSRHISKLLATSGLYSFQFYNRGRFSRGRNGNGERLQHTTSKRGPLSSEENMLEKRLGAPKYMASNP